MREKGIVCKREREREREREKGGGGGTLEYSTQSQLFVLLVRIKVISS